jgi:glucokinase
VFAAYDKKDALATVVINDAIELRGMASANYVSLFNPAKIIWGGGVFSSAVKFIDRIL